MVKTGQQRSAAYRAKEDPNVRYRRTKWGKQLWVENYIFSGFDPTNLDDHISYITQLYGLTFAQVQQYATMFRDLYKLYPNMRAEDLAVKRNEWILSGLEGYLFDEAIEFIAWVYNLPKPRYVNKKKIGLKVFLEIRSID